MSTLQDDYSEFIQWLQTKTTYYENLIRTNSLSNNYGDYLVAKAEADARVALYNKLRDLVASRSSVLSLTPGAWEDLDRLWHQHQYQLRYWLWMLDSNLPGDFGVVGQWLAEAEKLIYHDEIPTALNEESSAIISKKLEEHKKFFAGYDEIRAIFARAKQAPYANRIPLEQISNMEQRLNDIGPLAAQRRIRLKFLEHKCCLVAFLNLIENKMRQWTVKCGREDHSQQMLEQYHNFVHKNKVFQEFGKAFVDMQRVVEEYKRDGNITRDEYYEIDNFMRDTEDRWKRVSMDLKRCQNLLEEVVANWKRWNVGSDEFEGWLCRAEEKLHRSEDERLEFFQDISQWKDKHQQLGDAANFLIATCEEPIARELRDKFNNLSQRFDNVFANSKQYMYASDIIRNRQEYLKCSERLSNWIKHADNILAKQPVGSPEQMKQFGGELQKLASEVDNMEELFKHISKIVQSLVPDMSRDEVDKMMSTLRQQKDSLVRIRSQIPQKLHLIHQLITQGESLEQGQKEIHAWLDDAENLLQTLNLSGGRDQLREQLNKYRTFFSRTLYYKSMLESKNNVLQNLLKLVSDDQTVDTQDLIHRMNQLNDRFNYVTQNAQKWEVRLQDADNAWLEFKENERKVTEWIYRADVYLTERHVETRQAIEERKTFFESVNENWMNDLVTSGQNLLKNLPIEEQKQVIDSVENLQHKWQNAVSKAPAHIIRLQFNIDESTFNQSIREIEKEIQTEQQALNRNEDVDSILRRNQDFFKNSGIITQIEKSLEHMKKISTTYSNYDKSDDSLKNSVENAERQWESVSNRIDDMRKTLQQIPNQWDNYHDKFNSMISWMDNVDRTLKTIVREVDTQEEFERERMVFQVNFFFLFLQF